MNYIAIIAGFKVTIFAYLYFSYSFSHYRPVARVFEEGVLKLSAHKRGKFFGMTTPIFL